jgi:hypothetical protein
MISDESKIFMEGMNLQKYQLGTRVDLMYYLVFIPFPWHTTPKILGIAEVMVYFSRLMS